MMRLWWLREPALIVGAIAAMLDVAVSFGAHLSTDQVGAITAALSAVVAVVVRSRVTPTG